MENQIDSKICTACNISKSLTSFSWKKKDIRREAECKDCRKLRWKKYNKLQKNKKSIAKKNLVSRVNYQCSKLWVNNETKEDIAQSVLLNYLEKGDGQNVRFAVLQELREIGIVSRKKKNKKTGEIKESTQLDAIVPIRTAYIEDFKPEEFEGDPLVLEDKKKTTDNFFEEIQRIRKLKGLNRISFSFFIMQEIFGFTCREMSFIFEVKEHRIKIRIFEVKEFLRKKFGEEK